MLKNVVAFLTGAAGSLGSATARKLVAEGGKVVMLDLPDSKGQELADKLGKNALFTPGDVTSEEDVKKALEATTGFGHLNTVINCAAVHRAAEVYNVNKRTFIQTDIPEMLWRVNVWGTMNVIRLSADYLHQSPVDGSDMRGVIINTSGFAATGGTLGQVPLAAAWGAVESMTSPLAREFGERGIRVVTISPGLMHSNLTMFISKKVVQSFVALTPCPKRLGNSDEYADLVVSIIQNKFLNGEVIRLNGGLKVFF